MATYEIKLVGHLPAHWADAFPNMAIHQLESGETLLIGCVPDQAALFGLLKRIQNLGMPLLALNQIEMKESKW